MNIFLDLDGTLIDNSERYFQVYKKASTETNLVFEQFITLRKSFKNARDMFKSRSLNLNQSLDDFDYLWDLYIEHKDYLITDRLFPGVLMWLSESSKRASLIYCTNRRSYEDLDEQLEQLDIKKFASHILLSFKKSKAEVVSSSNIHLSNNDWFIGDTPTDIAVGEFLGLRTCGVYSGLNSQQLLQISQPDLLLSSVVEFKF